KLEEFTYLAKAFNRMTEQIQEQQTELIEANRQLDHRRRFTETVLEGVLSGVVGINSSGMISLANSSSCKLLGLEEGALVGSKITAILPEVSDLLDQAHKRPDKITQGEIPVQTAEGRKRIYLVRIAVEMIGDEDKGAVMTFDDITELQSAQRKAAWSDVARRIAHEIKNPLTPIQLSAERLNRKYLKQIEEEPETFSQCIETIIKHVGDIGRMVDEFSSFARMPDPVMQSADLYDHVKDTLFLHQQAHPEVKFNLIREEGQGFACEFDPQQMRQALNNLLQNAVDSIEMRLEKGKRKKEAGQIDILVQHYGDDEVVVAVTDNGLGLPKNENPVHLSEPYVTHKVKGTGLGLAIVKKIMEDHNGSLMVGAPEWLQKSAHWKDLKGATVALIFPLHDAGAQPVQAEDKKQKKSA
ncbi:MAG: PAS domain-containing protein, partial [Alphaproteobacteria bacterium]|nr:PAS domain-containing protein [Alphaproteobacteria bacterium]